MAVLTSCQEIMAVIKKYGIINYNVTSSYKSRDKRAAVNTWLSSLPSDSWTLYPDSDEFFTFPCSMQGLIEDVFLP